LAREIESLKWAPVSSSNTVRLKVMQRREFLGEIAAGIAVPFIGPHLYAQPATPPRWREKFNSGWLFERQKYGGGALGSFDRNSALGSEVERPFRNAHQIDYDDSWWSHIQLPHTWNNQDGSDAEPGYFRGIGWYRKHFTIDAVNRGKQLFLEFEGVNQVAEFWLNGHHLGRHQGGYTGFEFDITRYINVGPQANLLTAKVDNLYNPNIAPTVKTDLTFYGGIYRNAWLRFTGPVYISTLYWRTPRVTDSLAEIAIYSTIANVTGRGGSWNLIHEVLDPDGQVATRTEQSQPEQRLTVTHPRLWSPDNPSLYRIRSSLMEGGRLVDSLDTPLGLRWFRFDANQGFFLNGKRLQLRGTTWHQSYPGMGDALPDSRHLADMRIIREMGCNFFRTSHYPHAPAVTQACDQLGMLMLQEIFVGDEVENTQDYLNIQAKTAEEMILRDRNHPSVILWGFQGEIDQPEKSVSVVTALLNKFRQLDPTRLATVQDPRLEPVKQASDVVGLYSEFERDDADHLAHPDRKFLIEEYTVDAIGRGIYGMGINSEDLACVKHEEFLAQVNSRPWIAGSTVWHQFDYDGEEYDPVIPHVVTFGMADSWRIPKDVYFFYQSQWSRQPMLHICGHWSWPGDENKQKTVRVYSNCEEVELELNGESLGHRPPEKMAGLTYPPRIWKIPYSAGVLKATARCGSQTLSDVRKTAGPPVRIDLHSDSATLLSGDPESLAYLRASVVDKDGTVVPSAVHPISFTSYGPGELLPQTWTGHETGFTWNAVAGMTVVAFRATDRVGRAMVSAYSPGLQLGRAEIQVAMKGKRDEMEYRGDATLYR
jgi:beta-galactosidase